ncbi:coil containing protein [Vibrio phage 2.275.O._10N.286.54.E11]|nr:coil containing protein [Vibrio phage 2.275.O._10N.286.54.E11]
MTNIFALATRQKLRFPTHKGNATVEDLWDLPLDSARGTSINSLYVEIDAALKETQVSGLVAKPTKGSEVLTLKRDILKEIFEVRDAEQEAAKAAQDDKAHNQRILALIAEKELAAEGELSIDELKAKLK